MLDKYRKQPYRKLSYTSLLHNIIITKLYEASAVEVPVHELLLQKHLHIQRIKRIPSKHIEAGMHYIMKMG